MVPPAQTPSGVMAAILVPIKFAAMGIAIAVTTLLIYRSGFQWYAALAVGVLAYIAAKVVLSMGLGRIWGRQVNQDILNNAAPDVKERVAPQ